MSRRLPAHLEVAALLRLAQEEGGFGVIVSRGERDAGTIAIITLRRGQNAMLWERMPALDGKRDFTCIKSQDAEKPNELTEYISRMSGRDPDLWVVELDVDNPERFIANRVNGVDLV